MQYGGVARDNCVQGRSPENMGEGISWLGGKRRMQYRTKTQALVMTALMAALMAILSPFTIPVGPIPFSLALFAVYFAGAMLPLPAAMGALGVYILLGVAGLPVFSGFGAGPQVLVGATGGYIAGYFFIAASASVAVRRLRRFPLQLLLCVGGQVCCYALGTLWFILVTGSGLWAALGLCVLPFALPDIIKAALALGLARLLQSRMGKVRG